MGSGRPQNSFTQSGCEGIAFADGDDRVTTAGAATDVGVLVGHREQMLSSYTLILSAKRIVLGRLEARATAGDAGAALLSPGMQQQLLLMKDERDRWSLAGPMEDPELWVTAYSRLLSGYQMLLDSLRADVEVVEPEAREQLLTVDIPLVQASVDSQRERLQFWMGEASRS